MRCLECTKTRFFEADRLRELQVAIRNLSRTPESVKRREALATAQARHAVARDSRAAHLALEHEAVAA